MADDIESIFPTLIIPYSDVQPGSIEDSFNFWLSNSRIQIECTFGELIMRWGIFWKRLQFDLKNSLEIVKAASLLHNFLIETRTDDQEEMEYFRQFSPTTINDMFPSNQSNQNEIPIALVADNGEPAPVGRKTNSERERIEKGQKLRDDICLSLSEDGLVRPQHNRMRYNCCGHVYFVEE